MISRVTQSMRAFAHVAFALAVFAALFASVAFARTAPNVPGAVALDPSGHRPALAGALSAVPENTTAVVPVPLPAGAEPVDSTWYDLQDMGSLGARIVVALDGTVHVTYEKDFCELAGSCPPNPSAPDPFPFRGMGYSYRSGATWGHAGKVRDPRLHCSQCVPENIGGFGTLAVSPSGTVAISEHMNEDGCARRGDMYLEDTPFGSGWSGYLTPIPQPPVDPNYLEFPQVSANPNGSFTVMAESPRAGIYDGVEAFRVSYFAAPGASFTCPLGWQFGGWTSVYAPALFPHGFPGFPSLAHSSNGRVGIAVADIGGNVYLIESSNGTFGAGTITTRTLTSYSDASITATDSTSTQFRPYIHCHVAYNDTTPHVVWSELQARRVGGIVQSFDWHSRIVHWDPIRGVEVVKQVAQGEADQYDNVDRGLKGPLPGMNTITVDWPQVGFSADGFETYVAWLRFTDAEVDTSAHMNLAGIVTGVGFGDITASVTRPGEPWSLPQNLTSTPATDERFFSLAARNPGGRARVVFQASSTNQAGCAILGDRGSAPVVLLRRIAYLERRLTASLVSVPGYASVPLVSSMIVTPNPSPSRVRFALAGGARAAGGTYVDVFGVSGRRVARVAAGRDGSFEWNGRDAAGERAAAGVYFARVAGDAVRPVRFTLLP